MCDIIVRFFFGVLSLDIKDCTIELRSILLLVPNFELVSYAVDLVALSTVLKAPPCF